jgi:predicted DNA-binding antitoxin AbrB/MazE fold protein
MGQLFNATVENGVLRPDRDLGLSSGIKVRVTIQPRDDAVAQAKLACDELDQLCDQLPIDSRGERLTRDQLQERR